MNNNWVYVDASSTVYKGPIDCVKKLIHNNGMMGLYKGATGTLLFRSFMGLYFASYEYFCQTLLLINQRNGYYLPNAGVHFFSGAAAATILWTTSYPTDVIKNRMMSQPDVKPRRYESVMDCIRIIKAEEGIKGFYRGFVPCLLRAVPTNGDSMHHNSCFNLLNSLVLTDLTN
jgi:solute carrier family 25 carnitine/acylcarnitine transporter 20/29